MPIFLGQDLVFWTGFITGMFFTFNFLGCRFLYRLTNNKILGRLAKLSQKYHQKFIYLTFGFFILHVIFSVLRNFFNL